MLKLVATHGTHPWPGCLSNFSMKAASYFLLTGGELALSVQQVALIQQP